MEKLRIALEKDLPKRDTCRLMRSRNIPTASNFDSGSQLGSDDDRAGRHDNNVAISQELENGVVRLKIVVRKQDLKQVVDQLMTKNNLKNDCQYRSLLRSTVLHPTALSLEQRLNLMRRRHFLRAAGKAKACGRRSSACSWRPALQIIPE